MAADRRGGLVGSSAIKMSSMRTPPRQGPEPGDQRVARWPFWTIDVQPISDRHRAGLRRLTYMVAAGTRGRRPTNPGSAQVAAPEPDVCSAQGRPAPAIQIHKTGLLSIRGPADSPPVAVRSAMIAK